MMQIPSKIEMGLLKFIIARIKSKSPAMYANLSKVAGVIIVLTGAFIAVYNANVLPATYVHLWGQIDNICVVVGACATSLGFVSITTTSDPALVTPEVKNNVLQEAVDNGTHQETGIDKNG